MSLALILFQEAYIDRRISVSKLFYYFLILKEIYGLFKIKDLSLKLRIDRVEYLTLFH
jgi:hypothetical protein